MVFWNSTVMLFLEKLGPLFSTIRFFIEKRKQQTWECQVTAVLCCVSSVRQFTFERQEGRPEGSDLRQGFLPPKIVQPLRLKARSSFLYPSAMCLLDVWTRINELSLLLEVMHFDSRKNNMSALNNEHLVKIWNPGIVKARTRNCKLQLLRFVFSHEKPNAKGLYQCCHVK